ncbi:hypothetical protein ScPMuIL_001830 [Solemya velum]
MKGNRLRACRKAVHRVAISFAAPFLKYKNVDGNSRTEKYAVGDANHSNTPIKIDINQLTYTESNLATWTNASAPNDAKVTPVGDSKWAFLTGSNSSSFAASSKCASWNIPDHIGNTCKDYNIFQVSHRDANVPPLVNYTWDGFICKMGHPQSSEKSTKRTKHSRCAPGNTFKHIGDICKDYTVFQHGGKTDVLQVTGMDLAYAFFLRRKLRRRYGLNAEMWSDDESLDSFNSGSDIYISGESDYFHDDDMWGYRDPRHAKVDSWSTSNIQILIQESRASAKKVVHSLQDLSASVVAKHCACEELENSPLDELMLKKIAFWSFPQNPEEVKMFAKLCLKSGEEWSKGMNLVSDDNVINMRQVGFMMTATIKSAASRSGGKTTKDEAKVFVTFEKQRISSSSCSVCVDSVWCPHVIAAIVYRIWKAKKVPVHAPVTETLSTLSREQLQKLIQYAINKDPSSVLSSVFEYVDSIRDVNSEVNTTAGAPDPTFGTEGGASCHLDLTLEQLEKNFKTELRYGYSDYCTNYNISEKLKCSLYKQFVQQVPDLMSRGETTAACRVLKILTLATLDDMKGGRHNPSQKLRWLFYDLERILEFAATQINNDTGTLQESVFIERSTVAEPPSILKLAVAKENLLDGNKNLPFYETMCALFLDGKPDAYDKLIDGEVSAFDSDYDEPVSVMIMRMDAVLLLSPGKDVRSLAVVILKKLMKMSYQYSILQIADKDEEEELNKVPGEMGVGKHKDGGSVKTRGKRRMKRNQNKIESKVPKKKQKIVKEENQELTKEEIAFSLLYVWYRADFKISELHCDLRNFACTSALQALEMARLRTTARPGFVKSKEHDWLQTLEKTLANSLELNFLLADVTLSSHWEKYVKTFIQHGFEFYEGGLPLSLIDALIRCDKYNEKENLVLDLCVTALCSSDNPMEVYTIPSRADDHSNRYEFRRHYEALQTKLIDLVRTFLIKFQPDNELGRKSILKLLLHLKDVREPEFLSDVFRILKEWETKITTLEQKRVCVRMLICWIEKGMKDSRWRLFNNWSGSIMTFLIYLCKDMGVEFLQLVLQSWKELCNFFAGDRMKSLITKVKENIGSRVLPKDVSQLILKCLSSEYTHGEECCELLIFFESEEAAYNSALKAIRANTKNYSANALLQIAHVEYDRGGKHCDRKEVFTNEAFVLIQEAITKLKKYHFSTQGYDFTSMTTVSAYLDWVFKQFALKPTQSAKDESQFQKFLDTISTSFTGTPDFLNSLFTAIEKEATLLVISKSKLGPTLLEAYKKKIDDLLVCCTHSAYGRLIREMETAYQHCLQYVDNGGPLFVSKVLLKVRQAHKGKKKLLRLMNDNPIFGLALK